jgi:hypothetical protein
MADEQQPQLKRPPGWAAPREPKEEPHGKSLSLGIGKWLERARQNSFPNNLRGTAKSS